MAIKGKTEDGTVFINNNNNNDNSNGNFISVFESTIIFVNLATYRQFTIGCLRLNYQK